MKYLSLELPNPDPAAAPYILEAPPGVDTTSEIVKNIPQFLLNAIVVFGIILSILFIIFSGIQWITSGGDEKKIEGARRRLTFSIIGLVIVIASAYIISLVFGVLGIDPRPFNVAPITSPFRPSISSEEAERLRLIEMECRKYSPGKCPLK